MIIKTHRRGTVKGRERKNRPEDHRFQVCPKHRNGQQPGAGIVRKTTDLRIDAQGLSAIKYNVSGSG